MYRALAKKREAAHGKREEEGEEEELPEKRAKVGTCEVFAVGLPIEHAQPLAAWSRRAIGCVWLDLRQQSRGTHNARCRRRAAPHVALDVKLDAAALARLDEIFPGYQTAPEHYAW